MTPPSESFSPELAIESIRGDIKLILDKLDSILKIEDDHEIRTRALETTCPRQRQWDDVSLLLKEHDLRLKDIESNKCPKLPVLNAMQEKIGEIDTKISDHIGKEEGAKEALISNREYIFFIFMTIEGLIIIYQFIRGLS